MLALSIFQDSQPTLYVLAYFDWESVGAKADLQTQRANTRFKR